MSKAFKSSGEPSGLSYVTDKTREIVYTRDNLQCWVCETDEEPNLQIAHILPLAYPQKFQSYHAHGLLPSSLSSLSLPDNLIPLCTNCHGLYDATIPYLVILPINIGFFIEWEKEDYNRRSEVAMKGGPVPTRSVPSAEDYSGMFRAFYFSDRGPSRNYAAKLWKGAPTALILKASLGVMQPVVQTSPSSTTNLLPPELRSQVTELSNLYSRPDPIPQLASMQQGGDRQGPDNSGEGPGEGSSGKGKGKQPPRQQKHGEKKKDAKVSKTQTRSKTRRGTQEHVGDSFGSRPQPWYTVEEMKRVTAPWTFGPQLSSQDIIKSAKPLAHTDKV